MGFRLHTYLISAGRYEPLGERETFGQASTLAQTLALEREVEIIITDPRGQVCGYCSAAGEFSTALGAKAEAQGA